MSDTSIEKMDFKELRKEVLALRDELAVAKRKYEDILYNLDYDNFSGRLIKEKDNMKAEIKVTAEEVVTKISKTDLDGALKGYSTIALTDEKINLAVVSINNETDEKLKSYATTEYTANAIINTVSTQYIKDSIEGEYATSGDISTLQSQINQNADSITMIVSDSGSGKESIFKQTESGFEMSGNVTISGVDAELNIGNTTSDNDKKSIYFNRSANISTFSTIAGHTGIAVNSNGFNIASAPDKIQFLNPKATSSYITLSDYVSQYGGGSGGTGGTVIAVFG